MNQTDQDITVQADQLHAFAYTLYEKRVSVKKMPD
jgi:hypothetical protein